MKNEMGGACGRYNGQERCIQDLWWGDPREKKPSEDSGVDGTVEIKWIFRKWNWGGMDWIDVVLNKKR